MQNLKPLASHCSWAGQFESYLVTNHKDRFSCNETEMIHCVAEKERRHRRPARPVSPGYSTDSNYGSIDIVHKPYPKSERKKQLLEQGWCNTIKILKIWTPQKIAVTTVKFLKIRTSKKFAVIALKFEQGGFTIE